MRGVIFSFFYFFTANVQRDVTCSIHYNITKEFDFAKRDSRLAAYGDVTLFVLQRFEFLKV